MNDVLIINYDLNNITSLSNSLNHIGFNSLISNNPKDLKSAKKIILPGIGAFDSAINRLENYGWKDKLNQFINRYEIPLLGICLGMHLLAENSEEGKAKEGFGLIKGKIKKLEKVSLKEKIPHIGWNEVTQKRKSAIFNDIPNNSDFYFIHSYHYNIENSDEIVSETPYCGKFISGINKSNIYGVQFHPEKSGKNGLQLLKNFMNMD